MWRINYCCCSVASSCMTLCNHMDCSTRDSSFTISQGLLRLMSIESMMFCNHLILSPSCLLPSIFPSIRAFSNELLFASGGQSIGASALVLPMNIQGWVPLGLTGLISLLSKGLWRVFSNTRVGKHQFFRSSVFMVQLSHPYMTTGKTIALTRWIFVGKVTPLLFNMLSRFVIAFLPSSKCLLISWLQSPSTVIWEPPQNKVFHCFLCFPTYLPWSDGTRCHDLSFLNVEF